MIFLKNKGQLKNILHQYKVPEPDEKEIKDTVQLGQQQMRSLFPSRTTYSTLFKTQIRYITPYLLWAQLFIVALFIIFTLNISQPIKDLPKIIFLISPIFSLVAGSIEPSHVLVAMYGEKDERTTNSIRFSFGKGQTEEMMEEAAKRIADIVRRIMK